MRARAADTNFIHGMPKLEANGLLYRVAPAYFASLNILTPFRYALSGRLSESRLFNSSFLIPCNECSRNPRNRCACGYFRAAHAGPVLDCARLLDLCAAYSGRRQSLSGRACARYLWIDTGHFFYPYGKASDRLGRKPVIAAGLLIFALGSAVAAAAPDIKWIIAGRALQGAGAISSALSAFVADLTAEHNRVKAMAMIGAS